MSREQLNDLRLSKLGSISKYQKNLNNGRRHNLMPSLPSGGIVMAVKITENHTPILLVLFNFKCFLQFAPYIFRWDGKSSFVSRINQLRTLITGYEILLSNHMQQIKNALCKTLAKHIKCIFRRQRSVQTNFQKSIISCRPLTGAHCHFQEKNCNLIYPLYLFVVVQK